jgi:putative NADPH-quinone reductase
MQALVLIAHPEAGSFTHVAAQTAIGALERAGHEVRVIDLYAVGFRAAMSREERIAYDTDEPILDAQVAEHVEMLRWADALVFVYPTWWSGLPAILKGWLERIMVPGVGFTFSERSGKVRPGLRHIRHIVGITTWGSSRPTALVVNDNGRRVLTRALRMSCGWRTRTHWHALYGTDHDGTEAGTRFLERIDRRMSRL